MESQINSLPKANSVVIVKNPDEMAKYIQEVQSSANKTNASMLYVSCKNDTSESESSVTTLLIIDILKQIENRAKASWFNSSACWARYQESKKNLLNKRKLLFDLFNFRAWLKYRRANKEFANLLKSTHRLSEIEQATSFISHHKTNIKDQLSNVVEFENREFAILVITNFQNVPVDYQPAVAGLVHKIIKGTPMYFKIITVGEPVLFQKESTSEVGIQRNHDYIEIKMD